MTACLRFSGQFRETPCFPLSRSQDNSIEPPRRRATPRVEWWLGRNYGIGEWWELNEAFIDEMRRARGESKIPVLFIYIPHKSGTPFPALTNYMDKERANYIDLSESTASQRKEFYFVADGHLNARGHEYLGNLLKEWAPILLQAS